MAEAEKKKPEKKKGKYGPEEFLVRPEEVARLRQAAKAGGLDDDEFDKLLEDARRGLRESGKLELPPKLKAAVDKGKKNATPNLAVKARRRFLNRKGRQPEYVYGKKNPYFEGSAVERLRVELAKSQVRRHLRMTEEGIEDVGAHLRLLPKLQVLEEKVSGKLIEPPKGTPPYARLPDGSVRKVAYTLWDENVAGTGTRALALVFATDDPNVFDTEFADFCEPVWTAPKP